MRTPLVLALVLACGTPLPTPPSPAQGATVIHPKCADAVRIIQARDYRAWRGLPTECTPEMLAAALGRIGTNEGVVWLGTRRREVRWWPAKVAGYGWPFEVQTARQAVVRLDTARPELVGGLAAHLDALGAPAAKLPYHDETVRVADGEWVWPERGIAIYLSEDARDATRLALFPATDLATYRREIQPDLRVIEEPLR